MNRNQTTASIRNMKIPIFEEATHFFSQRGIPNLDLVQGPSVGWRTRAKLAVQGTIEAPLIGLYKEGTHEVEDMINCGDHHPRINEAIARMRQFIRAKKIEPYQEKSGRGVLRYLQFVLERKTGKVQLAFVINKDQEANLEFWNLDDSEFWHSIWLNLNTTKTNTILSSSWRRVVGPELLWDNLGGVDVCFHPASFAQANLDLFENMLKKIKHLVPVSAKIAEYYAGVGVIGLTLASKERNIHCCEITPQAKTCFEAAQSKLNPVVANRIKFHEGLATEHLELLQDADVVIVDPPRKGLDRKLIEELKTAATVKKLFYVSCGWKSFQRDCDELLNSGWKLTSGEAFLFFPGTKHLEILAVFEK